MFVINAVSDKPKDKRQGKDVGRVGREMTGTKTEANHGVFQRLGGAGIP